MGNINQATVERFLESKGCGEVRIQSAVSGFHTCTSDEDRAKYFANLQSEFSNKPDANKAVTGDVDSKDGVTPARKRANSRKDKDAPAE